MGKDEIPMTAPLLGGRFFDVGAFEKERNLEVLRAAVTACPAGQNAHAARPRALDRMSATWYPQVPEGHMLWLDCRRAGNVPNWPTLASLAVRAVLTFTSYEACTAVHKMLMAALLPLRTTPACLKAKTGITLVLSSRVASVEDGYVKVANKANAITKPR
ncbi:hypothetical protein GPECTOR_11g295 [Gonium pectorale]|uniref:Uncharacterized protein n=1 Tax=Gonium pectorale TaxID=33097 RepID=A0A150GPU3_GONPE|nr:hypothetical protein GPECTOR_11g295 [Gonium pectorale]|eukprot:KXZ51857.1 hypothetical protein GPECTOR_11g295 [Gonium pectorale]